MYLVSKKKLEKVHTLISAEKNPWKVKITGMVKWAEAVTTIVDAVRSWIHRLEGIRGQRIALYGALISKEREETGNRHSCDTFV